MQIAFRLDVLPRGQGRVRVGKVGGFARAYKAGVDRDHEQTLTALAAPHRPATIPAAPVHVTIEAVLPRPADLCKCSARTGVPLRDPSRRWHGKKPDLDNIAKAVLDALTRGGWWQDDALVVSLSVAKHTAALGESPHLRVRVVYDSPLAL